MDRFDSCPDSILQDIVSRLSSPSDRIALSVTCSRMHVLVLVPQFCQLRKKFGYLDASFIQQGTWLSIGCRGFTKFRDIFNRRDLGVFVREAEVETANFRLSPPTQNFTFLPLSEEPELLETAVDELGVRDWEDSGQFLENLRLGDGDARAALFLLMLRNLKKLTVTIHKHGDTTWISWVLRKTVSLDLPQHPKLSYGFLSLREVFIWHSGNKRGFELDRLAPFLLLPYLEKLSGFMVAHDGPFEWDGEFGVSPVTEIRLERSYVSVEAFGEFLRIPKSLNKFTYHFGGPNLIDEEAYDSDEVLRVVTEIHPMLPLSNIEIVEDGLVW